MATASDVRSYYEKVLTRMEGLRQYEASVADSLQAVEQRLEQFRADAPKDVFGQASDEWKNRTDAQREELLQRLKSILAALGAIESRARCPSPLQRRLLLAYGIATPLVLLILIFLPLCMGALPLHDDGETAHIAWIFLLILMMGALGGSLRLIGSLIYYLGKRSFFQSWLPYYYLAPVEGALIALIVCMLIFSGIFTPASATSQNNTPQAPPPAGAADAGDDDAADADAADADAADADAGDADADSNNDQDAEDAPGDESELNNGGETPPVPKADSNGDADDDAATDPPANPDGNQADDRGADGLETPPPGSAPPSDSALQPAADGAVEPAAPKNPTGQQNGDDNGDNCGVPVYMYAIAGLSGLFAKNVMRKLRDLADTLFGKPSRNDSA